MAALGLTLLSLLGFGLWGFLMKLGQQRLGALPHLMGMGVAIMVLVAAALVTGRFPLPPWKGDIWIPIAATVATAAAMLFLVLAFERAGGAASAVVALSALYPGVTAILAALFLKEPFSAAKLAGIGFAILAAFLFTR